MNISPTNNTQPSFKGVIVPTVDIYKRPMSSIVFRVVPDSVLKGIQMGERVIESENANLLTKFVTDPYAIHDYVRAEREARVYKASPDEHSLKGVSLQTFFNRLINELGLSHDDRNYLFRFMKSKEMTVKKAKEAGEFELRFEKPKQKPFTPNRHSEKRVD